MFKRFNERMKQIAPSKRWKNCCYKAADLVACISTLSIIYKVPIPVLSLPGYLIAGGILLMSITAIFQSPRVTNIDSMIEVDSSTPEEQNEREQVSSSYGHMKKRLRKLSTCKNAVIVFDSSMRSIGHFGILNLIFLPPAKAGFDFVDWENPRYPLNYFSMLYVIYCMYQSYQVFCESKQSAQVMVEFQPVSSDVINIKICEEKTSERKNSLK